MASKAKQRAYLASPQGIDKHVLYQEAVQHPPGDIHWMLKFYRHYISTQVPCHLREDFCGTALLSATWCKQDVRHTATGVDIDGEVLQWAQQHNTDGCSNRLCLIQANVLQPPATGRVLHQLPAAQQQQTQQAAADKAASAAAAAAAAAINQPQQQQVGFELPPTTRSSSSAAAAAPAASRQTEDLQTLAEEAEDAEAAPAAAAAAIDSRNPSSSSSTTTTTRVPPRAAARQLLDHRSPSARAADLDTPVDDATTITVSGGVFGPDVFGELELAERDDLALKPADIICAFNFSVCLLHKRPDVLQYFKQVRASLQASPGGVFVLDLMGGHTVEQVVTLKRTNFKSGIRYTFEQEKFNPLTRHMRCHISLQDPKSKQVLRRAFTYHWRMWSVSDVAELLREAGFGQVAVWVKPLHQGDGDGDSSSGEDSEAAAAADSSSSSSSDDDDDADEDGSCSSDDAAGFGGAAGGSSLVADDGSGAAAAAAAAAGGEDEAPYVEYTPASATPALLERLTRGWTAYVVAVERGTPPQAVDDDDDGDADGGGGGGRQQ